MLHKMNSFVLVLRFLNIWPIDIFVLTRPFGDFPSRSEY
jgi:hypothetical protein